MARVRKLLVSGGFIAAAILDNAEDIRKAELVRDDSRDESQDKCRGTKCVGCKFCSDSTVETDLEEQPRVRRRVLPCSENLVC